MSVESTVRAVTTYRLTEMKQRGEKIAMLTSYDYSMARIVDAAGIDVILLSDAGCFGIVLEKIPAALAARVTSEISAPTIGIGAGNGCDGQVLVIHDMLGINKGFSPRFLRRYADLYTVMSDAVSQYITDVKSCDFPNGQEQY